MNESFSVGRGRGATGSDGIRKRREKQGGGGEGCKEHQQMKKRGGVADKPSGSALSLWTACFRGQQKIS